MTGYKTVNLVTSMRTYSLAEEQTPDYTWEKNQKGVLMMVIFD